MADRELSRREILQLAAASGLGALMAGRADAKAPDVLGVQLYTVRNQIGTDAAATLRGIADIGYKEVEVIRTTLDKVGPLAKQDGLSPVSIHADIPLIMTGTLPNGYDLAACIRDAQAVGAKFLVMPYVMPNDRPKDAAGFEAFGKTFNKAGEQIKKAGLQLCYHNHAFEFATLPDGRRALDVMLAAADPALVKLELDVFWVSVAGADPVALINQYAGRIALMHLKDKMKGAPQSFSEAVPPQTFVEVGTGALDFPAILKAAAAAKVEHYFVEQDQSPDPLASLKKSYDYLRSLS